MWRTDPPPDPRVSVLARLLTVPVQQAYALLWRVGVVQVLRTKHEDRVRRDPSTPTAGADLPAGESLLPPPGWRLQPSRFPAPSPADPPECSQATG
ncbi:MAG TPA: Rv1535 domain-containing protein [Mycobacterium sp.]|nr:Rv1535 domain-containing protein [Mycobacterium sp.]